MDIEPLRTKVMNSEMHLLLSRIRVDSMIKYFDGRKIDLDVFDALTYSELP